MPNCYHIKVRRDTAANWAANNPVPADGEICQETDTKRKKIGDGVTAYNLLPYDQPGNATTSSAGLMSAADKQKLNGIDMSQYAKLNSPLFTGTPTAPTKSGYDVSKQLATDAYVLHQIASVSASVMVRCIFSLSANTVQNIINNISECVFMAVNGKAVAIEKSQKLVAGINYVDFVFNTGSQIACSKIPDDAFGGISNLTAAVLPERIIEVGVKAFSGCPEMNMVYSLSPFAKIDGTTFQGTNLLKAYVHKAFATYYQADAEWTALNCQFLTF